MSQGKIGVLVAVLLAAGLWWVSQSDAPTSGESEDAAGGRGSPQRVVPDGLRADDSEQGHPHKTAAPALQVREETPPPAPATGGQPPLPEGAVRVFGRVTGPDGSPAAGVSAALIVALELQTETRTDASGAFALVLTREQMGHLYRATLRLRSAGHGLMKSFGTRANLRWPGAKPIGPRIDLGTLVLVAGVSLEVRARGPAGAAGPVTFWFLSQHAWGGSAFFAKKEADESGRAALEGLPPGTWRILATAAGAGRGEVFLKLPQEEPGPVDIEMPEERTGALTVLDKDSQAPVAGARIFVQEFVQAPTGNLNAPLIPPPDPSQTDAEGKLLLRGLTPMSSLTIFVQAEGYPQVSGRGGVMASGEGRLSRGAEAATITLQKARTLSWPVVAGKERPVPADGTKITLRAEPGSRTTLPPAGIIAAGRLVIGGWPSGYARGLAVAPDGAMARFWCGADAEEGPAIHFVPARSIEVTVRYDDGAPASGLYVTLANQGNNPLSEPTPTDALGKARIENLFGGAHALVEVRVNERDTAWGGFKIGSIDLQEGDGVLEGTIRRSLRVTLRVRMDGVAMLPPITKEAPTGGLLIQMGGAFLQNVEASAETGELSFDWRPAPNLRELWVNVSKSGWLPFAEKRPMPVTQDPLTIDVELKTAGALLVLGKPPADKRRQRVNVQRWDPEKRSWEPLHLRMMMMGGYARFDVEGKCLLQPLETGRYRAVDAANFVVSEAADVVVGAEPPEVLLDASKAGFIRGVVSSTEGASVSGLMVHTRGGPDLQSPFGNGRLGGAPAPKGLFTRTNGEGAFWLRVPGTAPIELWAEGLGLRPAADGGRVTLTAPREGVVLKVVRSAIARLRFSEKLTTWMNPGQPRLIQVGFYKGKAVGTPYKLVSAQLDGPGEALEIGIFEAGTWTLWLDASPFQPVVLENVELGLRDKDLGTVQVSKGSSVTVEVRLKPGAAMPRLYLSVSSLGTPVYNRQANSGTRTTFSVSGLGPGRFQLRVGSHMGGMGALLNEEIDGNGTEEWKRVIDLTK